MTKPTEQASRWRPEPQGSQRRPGCGHCNGGPGRGHRNGGSNRCDVGEIPPLSDLRDRNGAIDPGLGRYQDRPLAGGVGLLAVLHDIHAERLLVFA